MRRLNGHRAVAARRLLEQLWADVDRIDLSEPLARRAGELAEHHGLRGYDAVHLASLDAVADADVVLVAADGELLAAARALGISTVLAG